mmetsp:Transcript_8849/g.27197  ORF Transcript_8849/g.27197 Transcript_8849/m.27197 type:complete len:307 (+) Transcript_8849:1058-1978(+)
MRVLRALEYGPLPQRRKPRRHQPLPRRHPKRLFFFFFRKLRRLPPPRRTDRRLGDVGSRSRRPRGPRTPRRRPTPHPRRAGLPTRLGVASFFFLTLIPLLCSCVACFLSSIYTPRSSSARSSSRSSGRVLVHAEGLRDAGGEDEVEACSEVGRGLVERKVDPIEAPATTNVIIRHIIDGRRRDLRVGAGVDGVVEVDGRQSELAEVAVAALEVVEALRRDARGARGPLQQARSLLVVPGFERGPEPRHDAVLPALVGEGALVDGVALPVGEGDFGDTTERELELAGRQEHEVLDGDDVVEAPQQGA